MSLPVDGQLITGGSVRIHFPHMQIDMSCDNEAELKSVIAMLEKCLEIHETNAAKMALIRSIDSDSDTKKSVSGYSGPLPGTGHSMSANAEFVREMERRARELNLPPGILAEPPGILAAPAYGSINDYHKDLFGTSKV